MDDRENRNLSAGLTDRELREGQRIDETDPKPLATTKAAVKEGRDTVITKVDTDEAEDGYVPELKEQP